MHQLTIAIADYMLSVVAVLSAQPGSAERENARDRARTDLEKLDAAVIKALPPSEDSNLG